MASAPVVILVVGVHRSGTSLLTSMLGALGAELGDVDPRANDENPRGFFESFAVRETNERILTRLGGRWDNFGLLPNAAELTGDAFAAEGEAALSALRPHLSQERPLVLKDPRLATLLPFWHDLLAREAAEVRHVLIVRDPGEVAASQVARAAKRPDVHRSLREAEAMAALWCTAMACALRDLDRRPTLLVAHDALYSDPRTVTEALASFAGLAYDEAALRCVDHELRRAHAAPSPAAWGALAHSLYRALLAGSTPRTMEPGEAAAILAGQHELRALIPYLPATAAAIAASHDAADAAEARARALRRTAMTIARAAVDGGAGATLTRRRERLAAALQGSRDQAMLRLIDAMIAEADGDLQTALALYEALAADPEVDAEPHRRLIALYQRLARHEDAGQARIRARKNFPYNSAFAPPEPAPEPTQRTSPERAA